MSRVELIQFMSVLKMSKISEKMKGFFCQNAAGVNGFTLSMKCHRATEVECVKGSQDQSCSIAILSACLIMEKKNPRKREGFEQSMFSKAKIFAFSTGQS